MKSFDITIFPTGEFTAIGTEYGFAIGKLLAPMLKKYGDDFIIKTINHEILHYLLLKIGEHHASFQLDELYRNSRQSNEGLPVTIFE